MSYRQDHLPLSFSTTDSRPIFLFPENELLKHLTILEPLSDAERAKLNAKIVRRHFQAGEELLTQGMELKSAHFVFSGIVQVTRQVQDGRVLNVRKLGPGDSFGDISLLTGMQSLGTFTASTSGILLELFSDDLKEMPGSCESVLSIRSGNSSQEEVRPIANYTSKTLRSLLSAKIGISSA